MPRLSVEDAKAVEAVIEFALAALPQTAPQRSDWERVHRRLKLRLAQADQRCHQRKHRILANSTECRT
jgi:hypothetical protein